MISHLITPQNMADKFMKFIETMDMSYLKAEVQRQAKKLLTSILKAKSFLQR